jgi:PPOX class probable F420-dependent enzyme
VSATTHREDDATVTTLDDVARLAERERYLCVVATLRADLTIQASLVNAGFMAHPVTDERVVGYVTYGRAKLAHLRVRPQTTITFRAGWEWATVEGRADLIGPHDPRDGFDAERRRVLLREVFQAAGGTHDDWDTYDRVMQEQGRTAVFVTPERIYSNG